MKHKISIFTLLLFIISIVVVSFYFVSQNTSFCEDKSTNSNTVEDHNFHYIIPQDQNDLLGKYDLSLRDYVMYHYDQLKPIPKDKKNIIIDGTTYEIDLLQKKSLELIRKIDQSILLGDCFITEHPYFSEISEINNNNLVYEISLYNRRVVRAVVRILQHNIIIYNDANLFDKEIEVLEELVRIFRLIETYDLISFSCKHAFIVDTLTIMQEKCDNTLKNYPSHVIRILQELLDDYENSFEQLINSEKTCLLVILSSFAGCYNERQYKDLFHSVDFLNKNFTPGSPYFDGTECIISQEEFEVIRLELEKSLAIDQDIDTSFHFDKYKRDIVLQQYIYTKTKERIQNLSNNCNCPTAIPPSENAEQNMQTDEK